MHAQSTGSTQMVVNVSSWSLVGFYSKCWLPEEGGMVTLIQTIHHAKSRPQSTTLIILSLAETVLESPWEGGVCIRDGPEKSERGQQAEEVGLPRHKTTSLYYMS